MVVCFDLEVIASEVKLLVFFFPFIFVLVSESAIHKSFDQSI